MVVYVHKSQLQESTVLYQIPNELDILVTAGMDYYARPRQHMYNSKTGLVIVADTVTTNVAGSTVDKVFIHPDITGFGGYTSDTNATGIACVAVHAGS